MIYFFAILVASAFLILVWVRLRDRRYLNAKTRDALSPAVRREIENDQKEFRDLQNKFSQTLQHKEQHKFKASEIVKKT